MNLQQILSLTRKCVDNYNLINEGDKIAVACSGGKDSLTLAIALNSLKRFYPNKFDVCVVSCDLGFKNTNFDEIKLFFDKQNIEFHLLNSNIAEIIFETRKELNPCSLCSKMRKGAMYPYIKELGYNKVALGHNKDDMIETMLMSMIYEGRINTLRPITYLDRTDITIIRPLLYVDESDIIGFANKFPLPILKSKCPADGNTKREYCKILMKNLCKENINVDKSLFRSCLSIIDGLL